MIQKLLIVQTTVAAYRTPLFKKIRQALGSKIKIICGKRFFDPTIRLDSDFVPDKLLKNHFFLWDRFLWQSGLLQNCLTNEIIILSLNPRILTNWTVLLIRRLIGKKTYVWGHAWPQKGKYSKSEKLRHLMRLLSNEIIVYTYQQKKELYVKMPQKTIHVAPNALYFKSQMNASYAPSPSDIIYVGRMVENKKVSLLYEAFKNIFQKLPSDSNLILIGDGPSRDEIMKMVNRDNLTDRVIMPGTITDIDELHKYYKSSLISISPGRVGLGLTQSLGFGVPMLIAKNELHGPEIEAASKDRVTFFRENDQNDLASKILEAFKSKYDILSQRGQISDFCKENYSIEKMAQTFIDLTN